MTAARGGAGPGRPGTRHATTSGGRRRKRAPHGRRTAAGLQPWSGGHSSLDPRRRRLLPGTAGSRQLITVQAPPGATYAQLALWTRQGSCWRRVAGPWQARLGRNGLSSHKREGDGATPTGTYAIGNTVYGLGRIPASGSGTTGCAAATGGSRIPRHPPTTSSGTSPAARASPRARPCGRSHRSTATSR